MTDRRVIACNLTEAISEASRGALCFVSLMNSGNAHERVVVIMRSRSGRWIRKWESIKRLGNFRAKTIPPESPHYKDDRISDLDVHDIANLQGARERECAP